MVVFVFEVPQNPLWGKPKTFPIRFENVPFQSSTNTAQLPIKSSTNQMRPPSRSLWETIASNSTWASEPAGETDFSFEGSTNRKQIKNNCETHLRPCFFSKFLNYLFGIAENVSCQIWGLCVSKLKHPKHIQNMSSAARSNSRWETVASRSTL